MGFTGLEFGTLERGTTHREHEECVEDQRHG